MIPAQKVGGTCGLEGFCTQHGATIEEYLEVSDGTKCSIADSYYAPTTAHCTFALWTALVVSLFEYNSRDWFWLLKPFMVWRQVIWGITSTKLHLPFTSGLTEEEYCRSHPQEFHLVALRKQTFSAVAPALWNIISAIPEMRLAPSLTSSRSHGYVRRPGDLKEKRNDDGCIVFSSNSLHYLVINSIVEIF